MFVWDTESAHEEVVDKVITVDAEGITPEQINAAMQCLIDNGIEQDEAATVLQALDDAICDETDLRAQQFLRAYFDCDIDAMVLALTGWNMEDLFAKACIIPDTNDYFGQDDKVAFPTYGIESFFETEFIEYLKEEYEISGEAWRMIQNTIAFAKKHFTDNEARVDYLWSMLEGTIGIPEEVVRKVRL